MGKTIIDLSLSLVQLLYTYSLPSWSTPPVRAQAFRIEILRNTPLLIKIK